MEYVTEKSRKHDSLGRVNIWSAAFTKRGRVISEAGNRYDLSHPVMARLGKKTGNEERVCLHSEVLTLLKARGKLVHSLYIARTKRTGEIGLAKPCLQCQLYIEEFEAIQGSKINVFYTEGENNVCK